jgi:hypothetical protein
MGDVLTGVRRTFQGGKQLQLLSFPSFLKAVELVLILMSVTGEVAIEHHPFKICFCWLFLMNGNLSS